MSEYRVVRMRDAGAALSIPQVRQLIFESVEKIEDLDAIEIMQWLLVNAHDESNFIALLAREDEWVGYVVCSYAPWTWAKDGEMIMVHCHGRQARAALKRAVADWMREYQIPSLSSIVRADSTWEATVRLWEGDGLHISKGRETVNVTLAE